MSSPAGLWFYVDPDAVAGAAPGEDLSVCRWLLEDAGSSAYATFRAGHKVALTVERYRVVRGGQLTLYGLGVLLT